MAPGTLLALLEKKLPRIERRTRWAFVGGGLLTWIGASAFSGSGMVGHSVNPWSLVATLPAIALARVVILVGVLGSSQDFFANKKLIYLGKISCGLYVGHEFGRFLAAYLTHARTPGTAGAQGAVALFFTFVLAAISYRWLEGLSYASRTDFPTCPRARCRIRTLVDELQDAGHPVPGICDLAQRYVVDRVVQTGGSISSYSFR